MANEEQLKILKQGVKVWNQWRAENPDVRPDLRSANLGEANLRWANLREADLGGANLNRADVSETDLSQADLAWADLIEANLFRADLSRATLGDADLRKADLREANLHETALYEADLSQADLGRANLSDADLRKADLREAILYAVDLRRATLSPANLMQAVLRAADLSGAHLSGADLFWADLRAADLNAADLSMVNLFEAHLNRADLSEANLMGTDLRGANLSQANLRGANLSGAQVGWTNFDDLNLSAVKGLDSVKHEGPSTVGIDTIYKSRGRIPAAFLRGCGVPETFITTMAALTGDDFKHCSCFISYFIYDQAFAERLYADLQARGVRCWLAPEDMEDGKQRYDQIDPTIRAHDKLLLVLSECSIGSQWMMEEIRRARQAEARDGQRKLFPIRLVGMDTLKAWKCIDADAVQDLAVEVRAHFVPDFSTWKEPDAYQLAFDRLLRDLKAEDG